MHEPKKKSGWMGSYPIAQNVNIFLKIIRNIAITIKFQ